MSIFREMESNLDAAWSDELRRTAYELALIDTIWDGFLVTEALPRQLRSQVPWCPRARSIAALTSSQTNSLIARGSVRYRNPSTSVPLN